jgi:hypothetical protein
MRKKNEERKLRKDSAKCHDFQTLERRRLKKQKYPMQMSLVSSL